MKPQKMKLIAAMVSMACSLPTLAALERVGPTSNAPSIGGFPSWYQDSTGLTLEFCAPQNAAEVAGGWCLLLPADVPTAPESFPNAYADEHFFFAADSGLRFANGGNADLILHLEAAFVGLAPIPGDQITFARIRVRITNAPVTGDYRIIHPYGEEVVHAVAGERIVFSDDVGINCGTDFSCALGSRMGPFLLPSLTPGGAELPAVAGPVPGKLHIADPGRSGPVTGSVLPDFVDSSGALRNHNIFRVEGPAGSNLGGLGIDFVETPNFSLIGRLHTGGIPGQVSVERASYARDAAGTRVDVFASAQPTMQSRLPTEPKPAVVQPLLSVYDAACGGTVDTFGVVHPPYTAPIGATESVMFADGPSNWAQLNRAAIPAAVCVKDSSARNPLGNLVPAYYPRQVTDHVTISQAHFDPVAGTVTVSAASSDQTVPPTLSVAVGNARANLVGGSATVPVGFAPPDTVQVFSTALGSNDARVTIGAAAGAGTPTTTLVAANDSYTFLEDGGPQLLAVLGNDSNAAGGVITVTSPPRFGTAVVNAGGTVTYTPNANANGTDAFTYTVTAGTQVSNTANVTLNITPVNDLPVAVNDTVNALANIPQAIAVLANDTDPDGAADLFAAVNVSLPTPAGATATVTGGVVNFTAAAPGTYSFTYQAMDSALATSNTATVTVQVAAAETLNVAKARYTARQSRLIAAGSITPAANQTITVEWADAAGNVLGAVGTTKVLPDGTWTMDVLPITPPTGATWIKATSSNQTVRFAQLK